MLFESKAEEIVKQTIAHARGEIRDTEDTLREKLKDFYNGIQGTDGYLMNYGFKDKFNKNILPPTTINITKKVIDKISLVYKRRPERELDITQQSRKEKEEEQQDVYRDWININSHINRALKTAERRMNLLGRVLFRPWYFVDSDRWEFFIETDYEPHFLKSDPIHPFAYSYLIKRDIREVRPKNIREEYWVFWSDELYFIYDNGGRVYTKPPWSSEDVQDDFGGINPFAVEAAITYGAKIVWFPTLSAKNHLDQMGAPEFGSSMKQKTKRKMAEKPITVLDERGRLIPEVYDVLQLIAQHDITMATGHLSIPEAKEVIKAAKKRKVKRLYVNHPEYIINGSIEEQKELASMGAFIEHLAIFMYPMWPTNAGIDGIVEMIKAVGPERTVLATDLGQVHNPPPWEGLRMFLQVLLEKGIPKDHLKRMVKDNPAYLLNIQ